ncbi:MAG: hypothetical protein ACFFE8_08215, partial [Candidatus Heimdallarchaeota archaeon]
PNEVDSLLSEINDFLYLRSSEIATDPDDRVFFTDAIKAIEECGSPSEIGDFLGSDDREPSQIESEFLKSRDFSNFPQDKSQSPESIISEDSGIQTSSGYAIPSQQASFEDFFQPYTRFKTFGFYRLLTLVIALMFTVTLLFDGYYPWSEYVSGVALNLLFVAAPIIFFWEGVLIHRWKNALAIRGMDRRQDDEIVLLFLRLNMTAILFKISLFISYFHFWAVPVYLILIMTLERQFQSNFWRIKLSPWISSLVGQISTIQGTFSGVGSSERFYQLRKQTSREGWVVNGLMISVFIVDFLGLLFVSFSTPMQFYYQVFGLRVFMIGICVFLAVITLGLDRYGQIVLDSSWRITTWDRNIMIWGIRFLLLRLFVTLPWDSFSNYFLLSLIIAEIFAETYGGTLIRTLLIAILTRLAIGARESPQKNLVESTNTHPISRRTVDQVYLGDMAENSQEEGRHALSSIPKVKPRFERDMPVVDQSEKKKSPIVGFIYKLKHILNPIVLTLFFLIVSFYEVILAAIILVTSFAPDGTYYVGPYDFNVRWWIIRIDYLQIARFPIWIWHGLLLLGIQLTFLVILDFYSLSRKRAEGITVKTGRIFSRIWMIIALLGIVYRINFGSSDPYTIPQGLIVVGLLIFSEITAWRNRVEHRKIAQELQSIPRNQNSQQSDIIIPSR